MQAGISGCRGMKGGKDCFRIRTRKEKGKAFKVTARIPDRTKEAEYVSRIAGREMQR